MYIFSGISISWEKNISVWSWLHVCMGLRIHFPSFPGWWGGGEESEEEEDSQASSPSSAASTESARSEERGEVGARELRRGVRGEVGVWEERWEVRWEERYFSAKSLMTWVVWGLQHWFPLVSLPPLYLLFSGLALAMKARCHLSYWWKKRRKKK